MKKPTTISKESVSEYRKFVQLRLRKRVLEAIEVVLEEEVDQALRFGERCGSRKTSVPACSSKSRNSVVNFLSRSTKKNRLPRRKPSNGSVRFRPTSSCPKTQTNSRTSATSYLSPSARCAPVNGLAGCYVSNIGKPHEYFDLTALTASLRRSSSESLRRLPRSPARSCLGAQLR